jgi:isopenicillin N synthase-like dioxygenase
MGSIQDATDSPQPPVITVSLSDLESNSIPLPTLEAAFGPSSLGILLVKDLPSTYPELRSKLLSYSSYLANLPASALSKVEVPAARYNVGWSHGKEILANGTYDIHKGSYYVQPVHNAELEAKAKKLYPDLSDMTIENVWPGDDVLPGFQKAFEELCALIIDVAALVARSCDRFGQAKLDGYRQGVLEEIVRGSVSTKARLLHYFPPPQEIASTTSTTPEKADDDWCGTHTDLGALTGLTSNMFVDEQEFSPSPLPSASKDGSLPPLKEMEAHPDPKAGLWIKDRAGRVTQVHIPRDCLAFQTGEALQVITQGKFRAVPHFVRGAKAGDAGSIARNTLAVFTQPNLWEQLEEGRTFADLANAIFAKTV